MIKRVTTVMGLLVLVCLTACGGGGGADPVSETVNDPSSTIVASYEADTPAGTTNTVFTSEWDAARNYATVSVLISDTNDVYGASFDVVYDSTLADYVDVPWVYAAGRLDLDSEGLLLLTNDGWLIHRLGHPLYRHPKTYLVQVEGVPKAEDLVALRRGVMVKERRTAPARVTLLPVAPDLPPRSKPIRYRKSVPTTWLRMVLTEGRKRQVRRMTAAVGYPTLRLVRVGLGPLGLEGLALGEWRKLAERELDALRAMLQVRTGR